MNVDEVNDALKQKLAEERLLPRGMKLQGRVVSTKRKKTVTIEREMVKYLSKYSRWAKVRSTISAHVPEGIDLKEGDLVEVAQTRKISKTKSWVVSRLIRRDAE